MQKAGWAAAETGARQDPARLGSCTDSISSWCFFFFSYCCGGGLARFSKRGIQVTEGFRHFRRAAKKGKPAASRVPITAVSQSIKDDLEIAVSKTVKVVHFF